MNKIYEDAQDLHIKSLFAYGKKSDHKLYEEPAYTTQLSTDVATDLFKKGLLLIVDGDKTLVPIALNGNKVYTIDKTGEPYEEFSATKTYAVGDVVLKSGTAYVCKTAISTAGAWDASKWDEIKTVDFVAWSTKTLA